MIELHQKKNPIDSPVAAGNEGFQENTEHNHHTGNTLPAQRLRLLDYLHRFGAISTLTARRDLDVLQPAARIHELRHRYGLQIDLVWTDEPTECGKVHRVGMYVLQSEVPA